MAEKMNRWNNNQGASFWRKTATIGGKKKAFTISVNHANAREALDAFLAWRKEQESIASFAAMASQDEKAMVAAGVFVGGGVIDVQDFELGPRPSKVHTLCDAWLKRLEYRSTVKKTVNRDDAMAVGSYDAYRSSIKPFIALFANQGLREMEVGGMIQKYREILTALVSEEKIAKHTANFRLQSAHMMFQWGYERKFVDHLPRDWKKLTKSFRGSKDGMIQPVVMPWPILRQLYAIANPNMKAWIWAALNFGFGPADIANLKKESLKPVYLEGQRFKTGVSFKFKTWDETRRAADAIRIKGKHKDMAHEFLFSSSTGKPLEDGKSNNHINSRMRSYQLKIPELKEFTFYSIRRLGATEVFSTHDYIQEIYLAHSIKGMGAVYTGLMERPIQAQLDEATEILRRKAVKQLGIKG